VGVSISSSRQNNVCLTACCFERCPVRLSDSTSSFLESRVNPDGSLFRTTHAAIPPAVNIFLIILHDVYQISSARMVEIESI